jgi:hypothetical protein
MYYNIIWSIPEGAGERLVLLRDGQGVSQLLHGGEAVGEVADDVEHLPHAHAGEHLHMFDGINRRRSGMVYSVSASVCGANEGKTTAVVNGRHLEHAEVVP